MRVELFLRALRLALPARKLSFLEAFFTVLKMPRPAIPRNRRSEPKKS
jgi:hypothetical protein